MVANYTILQPVDLYYGTGTKNNTPTTLMLPGDNKGHVWTIPMLSQGMPADITETVTANGYFQRADGNVVLCPGTVTGNVVTVTLLQACYAIEGNMLGVVRVTNATTGMITTLCEANFRVSKALNGEIIDPGEVIPDIDNLLAQIAAMEAATAAANTAASNANKAMETLPNILIGSAASPNWVQGSIRPTDGANMSSATRVRSGYILPNICMKIDLPDGMKAYTYRYTDAAYTSWISDSGSGWFTGSMIMPGDGTYYKIVLGYTSDAEINVSAVSDVVVTLYDFTDTTLTMSGKAADAAATASAISGVQTTLQNLITANTAAIAPAFSTGTAYNAGDYVYYNGTLYRFAADHAAGAWIGTDAVEAAVGWDVSNLEDSLAYGIASSGTLPLNRVISGYVDPSGGYHTDSHYSSYEYLLNTGKCLSVTATGANSGVSSKAISLISFFDASNVGTGSNPVASGDTSIRTGSATIPQNAAKVLVTVGKDYVTAHGVPSVSFEQLTNVNDIISQLDETVTRLDDEIAALSVAESVEDYLNLGLTRIELNFEQGTINDQGDVDATTRIRQVGYLELINDILVVCDAGYQAAIRWYEYNGETYTDKGGSSAFTNPLETTRNLIDGTHVRVVIKKEDGSDIVPDEISHVHILGFNAGVNAYLQNDAFHNVCHRGFSVVAPENTIPAFALARRLGFRYVESDVQFTSDGVPVILHDRSISRTSNGTGNIDELPFSQVRTYDFGSWKNPIYAGTQIPTFDEFLKWCKRSGAAPYIEIKTDVTVTQAQMSELVGLVVDNGMRDHCTWISFGIDALGYIHNADAKARIGYLVRNRITAQNVTDLKALQGENEVFFLCHSTNHNFDTTTLSLATSEKIKVEVTIVDTDALFNAMDARFSGNVTNGYPTDRKMWEAANGTV